MAAQQFNGPAVSFPVEVKLIIYFYQHSAVYQIAVVILPMTVFKARPFQRLPNRRRLKWLGGIDPAQPVELLSLLLRRFGRKPPKTDQISFKRYCALLLQPCF